MELQLLYTSFKPEVEIKQALDKKNQDFCFEFSASV